MYQKITSNIVWKLLERSSSLMITLAVNILLTRLLPPSDFGLIAMVTVFTALTTTFVTSGLANSLVQKKNADDLDFSTIFWLNALVSGILYTMLYFFAPVVSSFYNLPELAPLLRTLSITILFSAVKSVQYAYIIKQMLFKHFFVSTLSSKIVSGFIGVLFALLGYGVWALVVQSITLILLETIVLWFRVQWRPKAIFSWNRAKSLYSFSIKIMCMSFIESIKDHICNLLIGKNYSTIDLAFYTRGALLPTTIITNITSSLSAVMFPVLSQEQDSMNRVVGILRRWISLFAYVCFPLAVGLAMASENIILVLFTEKWIESSIFMIFSSVVFGAWVIEVPIRETIKSLGHASACLNMQVIKTAFALVILFCVVKYGMLAIAFGSIIYTFFNIAVSLFYAKKYLNYDFSMLIEDVGITVLLNITMAIVLYLVQDLSDIPFLNLVYQVSLGFLVYISISIMTKNSNFIYIWSLKKQ